MTGDNLKRLAGEASAALNGAEVIGFAEVTPSEGVIIWRDDSRREAKDHGTHWYFLTDLRGDEQVTLAWGNYDLSPSEAWEDFGDRGGIG